MEEQRVQNMHGTCGYVKQNIAGSVIHEEGACAHRARKLDREEKPEQKGAYVPKGLASEEGVEDLAVFHMDFSGKEDPVMRQCLCLSF